MPQDWKQIFATPDEDDAVAAIRKASISNSSSDGNCIVQVQFDNSHFRSDEDNIDANCSAFHLHLCSILSSAGITTGRVGDPTFVSSSKGLFPMVKVSVRWYEHKIPILIELFTIINSEHKKAWNDTETWEQYYAAFYKALQQHAQKKPTHSKAAAAPAAAAPAAAPAAKATDYAAAAAAAASAKDGTSAPPVATSASIEEQLAAIEEQMAKLAATKETLAAKRDEAETQKKRDQLLKLLSAAQLDAILAQYEQGNTTMPTA